MRYTIKIIFGKEQVEKFHNDQDFTTEENAINIKDYSFSTEAEKLAFCKGVEEAIGWTECYILENEIISK
jgi:hypothetical protein